MMRGPNSTYPGKYSSLSRRITLTSRRHPPPGVEYCNTNHTMTTTTTSPQQVVLIKHINTVTQSNREQCWTGHQTATTFIKLRIVKSREPTRWAVVPEHG